MGTSAQRNSVQDTASRVRIPRSHALRGNACQGALRRESNVLVTYTGRSSSRTAFPRSAWECGKHVIPARMTQSVWELHFHVGCGNRLILVYSTSSQAPAWEFGAGSSSFPSREAGASSTGFPSWSLGTSANYLKSICFCLQDGEPIINDLGSKYI